MKTPNKKKGDNAPKQPNLSEIKDAYKMAIKKCEEANNKEFLDFFKKMVINEAKIKLPDFMRKALLGEKTFRNVVIHQKRPLEDAFKQRICIGIGLIWQNIVRILTPNNKNFSAKEREEKANKLKQDFIQHLGSHMKNTFIMMENGTDLDSIARYLYYMADKSKNFNKREIADEEVNGLKTTNNN